jgi:formylmethanofuran dehydrogenase subunit B
MGSFSQQENYENVTCPFCGLLCDDLSLATDASGSLTVTKNGCPKSIAFFERKPSAPSPRIKGNEVELTEATKRAAGILSSAKLPLIAGLGTEVQGMRAVMSLADKAGAVVDHMNSNGFMRNIQVVQNSGWQITTLTEVRNRVDLLLVIGTDIVSTFPRFFEREVWNQDSMFGQDTSKREVVYLGGRDIDTSAGTSPNGRKAEYLSCDLEKLSDVVAALRTLVIGKPLQAAEVAGLAMSDLQELAERLKAAQYSVVAWAAAPLNFAHAELTVQNIAELVKELNKTTRSNGLPLGGIEGDMSANQVAAWISGYPVRTSYARSYPEHDPYHFSTDHLLASGEADALFWISSFNPERTPPKTSLPTVVLGHPDMKFEQEPEVFIPIGLPGADHKGIMFRTDSVVSLPLEQLRHSPLPDLASVLAAIEKEIPLC